IGTGQEPNEDGNRQLAFIGLGPLTGFSTFSSPDHGRTLQRSPDQNGLEKFNQTSLVDRQWLVFTDDQTVFLNYNGFFEAGPQGQLIQKSTDGGITYGPQYSASTDGNRLGQIRAIPEGVVPGIDPTKDVVYFPYNSGNLVKLAMSLDGGDTFSQCLAVDAEVDPTAGFIAADHDSAGNIYVTYTEKGGGRDTYLVALAADGGMPNAGRPGLELFDQPSWGMTDFTQRINYRRALEGELERTIGNMAGIESAQVHLALEENAGFREAAQPPEASVVLKLRRGGSPSKDVVEGISHLVAGSVDGIDAERVTVLDDGGRLLSSAFAPGSPAALASRELTMRSEMEKYLEAKAEQIVTQIVGPGNARVQISVEINGDRVERTVETVDPERQVLASEQRSEIIPGAEGGAGSSNVSANYLNSRTVETFSGAVGNARRISAAVLVNDRIDDAVNGGAPQTRSPEELARIQSLVQSAIGLNEGRGDVISVVSVPFGKPAAEVEEGMDVMGMVQQGYKPGIMLLAIVFAFVFGLRAMRALQAAPVEAAPAVLAATTTAALPGETSDVDALDAPTRTEEIVAQIMPTINKEPSPGQKLREEVVRRLEEQPEVSLRLVRAWLKDS
ncbi:MAG: flagellar M-ring protein FliF, partial [Gemmatimonadetes bacterium]|nr:flagellar M-ring protein FliF [Gemmatimonadota bacterium]